MKVLHINKLYSLIGGVENHLLYLSHEISRKYNVSMKVIVCNSKFRNEKVRSGNVEILKLASTPKILRMPIAPAFPLYLKKESNNIDIIHFHHPFPLGEMSYLLTRPLGRVVVTWHSDIISQKRSLKVYSHFLLRFLKRADVILATSPNYVEYSPFLSIFRDKCEVIPLGIDVEKFRLTQRTEAEAKRIKSLYGPGILLYIGKLRYYKGIEYLIRAMKYIEAKLIIIGEGPLGLELKELTNELNLLKKIKFFDHLSDEHLIPFYHACDIFILPSVSRSEAFGIVQLEAMACGKPVVSTNLPTGVPFVNQHEKTGLVVPPKDIKALAAAINVLLANPDLSRKYGSYAKRRVENEFTKELVADRVMAVYRELMN